MSPTTASRPEDRPRGIFGHIPLARTRVVALFLGGALVLSSCGTTGGGERSIGTGVSGSPDAAASGAHPGFDGPAPCPDVSDRTAAERTPSGQPGGQYLPALVLSCLGTGGEDVSLQDLTGPAVVNLWASWCGPCREEIPAFNRLAAESGDRIAVWGVVSEDTVANALDFVSTAGVVYPSVVDVPGTLRRSLARPGLPVTVFMNGDGSVARVYSGPALTYDQLLELIQRHLGVAP